MEVIGIFFSISFFGGVIKVEISLELVGEWKVSGMEILIVES